LRLGFGSAIGVVVFVLVMLVAAAYLRVLRRQEMAAGEARA
jgi:ABC-type sugar transport system permease subunit